MSDSVPPSRGQGQGQGKRSDTPPSTASPTPTVRPTRAPGLSPLGLVGLPSTLSDGGSRTLGIGHPRRLSDFRIHSSQPSTPLSPPSGMTIPTRSSRSGSITSEDDDDFDGSHATPRTGGYFPPQPAPSGPAGGEARRVSEVKQAAAPLGTSMSPSGPSNAANSGSLRVSRPRLATAQSAGPSTNVSRSGSRIRLPLPHAPARTLKDDLDDDELKVVDRGEDLIRRRIKERKRAKRERERRMAEYCTGDDEDGEYDEAVTSAPTSARQEAFTPTPARVAAMSPAGRPRAVSRPRAPSATRGAPTTTTSHGAGGASEVERPESLLSVPMEDEDDQHLSASMHTDAASVHDEEFPEEDEELGDDDEEDESGSAEDDEGVTVKDRQDAINLEHPFGLPIWKPALYRKSRSVTRNAESALHSIPSAAAERHLLLGNLVWVIVFGWWLALTCAFVAIVVTAAELIAGGRGGYGKTLRGLAWYIGWPFGKYVEGEGAPDDSDDEATENDNTNADEENAVGYGSTNLSRTALSESTSSSTTVRAAGLQPLETLPDEPVSPRGVLGPRRQHGVSFAAGVKSPSPDSTGETVPLITKCTQPFRKPTNRRAKYVGSIFYWPSFILIVAPVMLFVCVICWFLVVTIPMAKLTWELLVLLWNRPLEINFRPAPKIMFTPESSPSPVNGTNGTEEGEDPTASPATSYTIKRQRLTKGQVAPTAGPTSTVLLCTYRAVGLQYYKYTVGGVNIMFINLLPLVFFTIIDGMILLPIVEKAHHEGRTVSPILAMVASQALIFVLGLASVIPLSYFIGMAVASISAQSSIGMGAVINATFGSIIEIVLYGIALTQGKGRLVEGSIVGSILAGVLLMPGASMCSGALKRKEQKFNAKSAGVTSTMLIMAIIGVLTPTMFYQTYGSFQIHCQGCPEPGENGEFDPGRSWQCNQCWYEHPDPTTDPFYQDQVKTLMYSCAVILLLSYLIGLWFSLRTHASQIWQNPQQLMAKEELQIPAPRASHHLARITPAAMMNPILPVHSKPGSIKDGVSGHDAFSPRHGRVAAGISPRRHRDASASKTSSPLAPRRELVPEANTNLPSSGYTPYLDSIGMKGNMDNMPPLPGQLTQEDVRRAVHTLASVGALPPPKASTAHAHAVEDDGSQGGHEAPSWTRGRSAAVLLSCTVLYAAIAEVLVDVVDVVLHGSGVDEKFLGLTLFALVPNTTEFMNAMSFAMNGNIALSMEIGSAYALQVCLLQIPAMVAFSAFYDPKKLGDAIDTFTLIFPRWDVIAIILSIFLLTYTYIEARSNYHRGSILVLAYCVLVMGFYYAPTHERFADTTGMSGHSLVPTAEATFSKFSLAVSKLWA